MKHFFFIATFATLTLSSCARLPQPARDFISIHFPHTSVKEVEKEKNINGYSVELKDRTELEFTANGDWLKVDGEDGHSIPTTFFPKKIADYVTAQGLIIEGIRKTNIGYKVDIIGSHTDLFFNHNGEPIGNY
ncbi:hypothetical protein RCZ04_23110 [Capnocytophaga sp. HP1101]